MLAVSTAENPNDLLMEGIAADKADTLNDVVILARQKKLKAARLESVAGTQTSHLINYFFDRANASCSITFLKILRLCCECSLMKPSICSAVNLVNFGSISKS